MNRTYPPVSRVPAVDRAFDLLETLMHSNCGLTVTELSRDLAIPPSTTYDLVCALLARGYLQRIVGSRRYSLGVPVLEFGPKDSPELQLRQLCWPYIRALAREVVLPVEVSTRIGHEGIYVARAVPPAGYSNYALIGQHFPLHCTAQGKVLIAWLSAEELRRLFVDHFLSKFTPKTICSFDALSAQLVEVRQRGFAVNFGEYAPGEGAIGAPVFNQLGTVVAAVGVGGFTHKPSREILSHADRLISITQEITRQISQF